MIIINRNLQIIHELIAPGCAVIFAEANPPRANRKLRREGGSTAALRRAVKSVARQGTISLEQRHFSMLVS